MCILLLYPGKEWYYENQKCFVKNELFVSRSIIILFPCRILRKAIAKKVITRRNPCLMVWHIRAKKVIYLLFCIQTYTTHIPDKGWWHRKRQRKESWLRSNIFFSNENENVNAMSPDNISINNLFRTLFYVLFSSFSFGFYLFLYTLFLGSWMGLKDFSASSKVLYSFPIKKKP